MKQFKLPFVCQTSKRNNASPYAGPAYLHPSSPALPALVAFSLFQGIWPLLSVASNDLAAELAPIGEGTAMGLFNAAAAAASALGAITGGAVPIDSVMKV
jgi:predicted MFS family arabinose efflux permease